MAHSTLHPPLRLPNPHRHSHRLLYTLLIAFAVLAGGVAVASVALRSNTSQAASTDSNAQAAAPVPAGTTAANAPVAAATSQSAATPSPPAAAPLPNIPACKLLTAAEITNALKFNPGPATLVPGVAGVIPEQCQYGSDATHVAVSTGKNSGRANYDALTSPWNDNVATPAKGIGDKATLINDPISGTAAVVFVKGDKVVMVSVVLTGKAPNIDAAVKLANIAASRTTA